MFHRDPKRALIHQISLFEDCSAAQVKEIAAIADELDLPAGKTLTVEGADGREFLAIISGTADVYRHGTKIAEVGSGDVVGEIALVTGQPRTATVVATSPVTLLVITRHQFLQLVDHVPNLRRRVEEIALERSAA